MKNSLYHIVYRSLVGVLVLSLFILVLVEGLVPFGLQAAWSEEGAGVSLVLTRQSALHTVGERIAVVEERTAETTTGSITAIERRGGSLTYTVSAPEGESFVLARDVAGSVVTVVPVVGVWVRALSHMLGVMALVGLPLTMLAIDILLGVAARLAPGVAHSLALRHTVVHADDVRRTKDTGLAQDAVQEAHIARLSSENQLSSVQSEIDDSLSVRVPPRKTIRRLSVQDGTARDTFSQLLTARNQRYGY